MSTRSKRSKTFRIVIAATLIGALIVSWPAGAGKDAPVVTEDLALASVSTAAQTLTSPIIFTMFGITYDGEVADFEVRTSSGADWSAWLHVDTEIDEGPDATSSEFSKRLGTPPIWTGAANRLQLRLETPATISNVQIHFFDATGRALSPLRRMWSNISAGDSAEAAVKPAIVGRKGWGADERKRRCAPEYSSSVKGAFVHHTAGRNNYSRSEAAAIVRSIYQYHTQSRGWCDIGYNFLIDRFGVVYEGRYGGMTRPLNGAHTGGFNESSTGIALIGNFSNVAPTRESQFALTQLLGWKLSLHGVHPRQSTTWVSKGNSKYSKGQRVTLPAVAGHKDASSTSCPAQLHSLLRAITSRVIYDFKLPDGSLVKADSSTVYLVENGKLRPIISSGAFASQFKASEIVRVTNSHLTKYGRGSPFGYREGSLLRTPDDSLWIISGGERRSFDSKLTFDLLGFSEGNVFDVTQGEASRHKEGDTIVAPVGHPDGTIVKGSSSAVWLLEDGGKRLFSSARVFNSQFRWSEIVEVSDLELSLYPQRSTMRFREGSLVRTDDGTIWAISGGKRRGIPSADVFWALGYRASNVRQVTWPEAKLHLIGPLL